MTGNRFIRQWVLDDRARAGEVAAELQVCRCVLDLARHRGWPKLTLATGTGQRTIRPTPVAWQCFVFSQPPAVLIRTLYALWPKQEAPGMRSVAEIAHTTPAEVEAASCCKPSLYAYSCQIILVPCLLSQHTQRTALAKRTVYSIDFSTI